MTRKYAQGTAVDATRSRIELEELVKRFGANQIMTYTDDGRAMVQFTARERLIRITLPIPSADSEYFTTSPTGRRRTDTAAEKAHTDEVRRRWRAMVLLVKAKLTAVQEGIVEFESEFLPHVVLSDGRTVFERTQEQIALEYRNGSPQMLLPNTGGTNG